MNLVVHVLRRMGGRATTLLPFSLLLGIAFQDAAAAFRPLVEPGAIAALVEFDPFVTHHQVIEEA